MKKVIIDILKKYKFNLIIISIFILINMYIATIPSKTVGIVVDLLYDIEKNKSQIINNII